jgi:hypothetical protein
MFSIKNIFSRMYVIANAQQTSIRTQFICQKEIFWD